MEAKRRVKENIQYYTPPTNDYELKYLIIELIQREVITFPIDSFSLYRYIKKIFKFVENSVFIFNKLEINLIIKDMIDNGCFDSDEIMITLKRSFYLRKINNSQFKAYSQKILGVGNFEYNSIVNHEKYIQVSKSLMLESLANRKRNDNLLKIKSQLLRKDNNDSQFNQIPASLLKFKNYIPIYDNKQDSYQEEDEEAQNIMNSILFRPSARALLNSENEQNQDNTLNNINSSLKPFCTFGTKSECIKKNKRRFVKCELVHFIPVIKQHTDVNLGDCSYLDTCRHMDICKFVHYEIENSDLVPSNRKELVLSSNYGSLPSQWINCDIRHFDLTVLGKFQVIMADPPWDIHMDLPYGTLSDEEMKNIKVSELQTDGVIFLWVTGRATELARECLDIWGYERQEELVWIKTNQLQRLIRTGRTGHWLNHSKEHCLIGIKGNPLMNRNIDCDVLVSEVRETSRKPDEIYELIERMCPNGRKVELFARPHNRRYGWTSLGNQLPGAYLVEDEVIDRFNNTYPTQKLTKEEMEINRVKSIETKEIN